MALTTIANGTTLGVIRAALNTMLAELYAAMFNPTPTSVSGTTHTLALVDVIGIDTTGSAACVITIPLHADVPIPVGSEIPLTQLGTGALSVAVVAGVTPHMGVTRSLTISGQYEGGLLRQTATDVWLIALN